VTLPRIAIVGAALEASTYSPARTGIDGFVRYDGTAYFDVYPFLAPGGTLAGRADWVPLTHFRAIPGGAVPLEVWDELSTTLIDGLRRALAEAPLDGVLVDLHGAMSVDGVDDPEGELVARIRGVVGPGVLLGTGMDLHGNVSERLATCMDLLTCYRMAPHEDALETKERAAHQLVERIAEGGRPVKARVAVPILLPGEKTSTRIEPARSLYAGVPVVAARPGVLDAAIWIGYAWADEPRNHAAIVVMGDDEAACVVGAEELAAAMWRVRDDFEFVAPAAPLPDCLAAAVATDAGRPYFISDSGDNPTAGGAGDVTWTLARLLESPEIVSGRLQTVYASIPDAAAVDAAVAAGVGAAVALTVGARVDAGPEGPVALSGLVEHIATGDATAQTEVVIRHGGLRVILTRRRKPYHLEGDFLRNGIDARAADIVVVKIGYLEPELYAMAADWMLALTPGGVDQDLARLPHHRIRRPMAPYDVFVQDPDLTARLMPSGSSPAAAAFAAEAESAAGERAAR
jgi:microcystin degradation protein MlrC